MELLAAILVSALVMAAVAPVLSGAVKAKRAADAALAPLPEEEAALALLRRDLAEMDPASFFVEPDPAGVGASVMGYHLPAAAPLAPGRAHDREKGGVTIRWELRPSAGRPGLSWVRERTFDAADDAGAEDSFGSPAFPDEDALAGPFDAVQIEALQGGTFLSTLGTDPALAAAATTVATPSATAPFTLNANANSSAGANTGATPSATPVPSAVRVAWIRPGMPLRAWVLEVPQVRIAKQGGQP